MSQSGANNKISAGAARSHTRKSKPDSSVGILRILLLAFLAAFCAWAYQTAIPPPPKTCGSPNGPPITSPRIKLRDGRHISYTESGVPKDEAKSKIVYVHCFDCCKYHNPLALASPAIVEELGVYIISIDRPGYGESDPDPKRTVKSFALDVEELADQMNLGQKFYVAGFSMGGQTVWSFLKYIPHRLEGAVLIAPAVNYWWPNLPLNLTNEAFSRQSKPDQWAMRVAHYLPQLTYWWNTQKWFPSFSVIDGTPAYGPPDIEILTKAIGAMDPNQLQVLKSQPRLQGEFESVHRDLNIGFGKWNFDPMDIENPFPNKEGSVHIWMGDEDLIVPVTLQRYIAQQLGWIKYHEVTGGGHLFAFGNGVSDAILKELLSKQN